MNLLLANFILAVWLVAMMWGASKLLFVIIPLLWHAIVWTFLWAAPESIWRRRCAGGYWIHYQTSLPMAPVWEQREDREDANRRPPCLAYGLGHEDWGPIKYKI